MGCSKCPKPKKTSSRPTSKKDVPQQPQVPPRNQKEEPRIGKHAHEMTYNEYIGERDHYRKQTRAFSDNYTENFTDDFKRILTEPDASLTAQYTALMKTEGVNLEFAEDGVERVAEVAFDVNERSENIGARRLHTVVERLLEEISFDAPDKAGQNLVIDREYVDKSLGELVEDEDLSRYIL